MRIELIIITLVVGAMLRVASAEDKPPQVAVYEGKPTSHWIAELQKEDLGARRKAVYGLFKLGPAAKDAAALLARTLEDEDDYVRDTAYSALMALKEDARPAVKALRSALNDGRERVRRLAMWALLRIDPPTVFRDEDCDVRKAAILVVIQGGHDFVNAVVFDELAARTAEENGEIRTWAARALRNCYAYSALERPYAVEAKAHLAEVLSRMAVKDEEALARRAAVYALGALARYPKGRDLSVRIRSTLNAAARDESPEVRSRAFISLSGTGKSEEAEEACLTGGKDKDASVRATAVARLSSASEGGAHVVAALILLLGDEDLSVRRSAASSLGWFAEKSSSAVPAMMERLRVEKYPGTIAKALGDIGAAARPALPQLEDGFATSKTGSEEFAYALLRLGSPNRTAALDRLVDIALSDVSGRAQFYLGALGATAAPAVPSLIEALSNGTPASHKQAAWTLRAMGPIAKPAVPALEALLKKDAGVEKDFATAVREALKAIRGS